MIGNKERCRLCQEESFCVSGRQEADRCLIVRAGGESAVRSLQEGGIRALVAGEMHREKILVEKMDLCLTEWED